MQRSINFWEVINSLANIFLKLWTFSSDVYATLKTPSGVVIAHAPKVKLGSHGRKPSRTAENGDSCSFCGKLLLPTVSLSCLFTFAWSVSNF